MHITMEADYAVRIVDTIARNEGRVTSDTIAEQACVTHKFSLLILRKLVAKGIVSVFRGSSGGYELARPADEITIYEVLQAIAGPLVINRCTLDETPCNKWPTCECPYRNMFNKLTCYIQEQLADVTFADVVNAGKQTQNLSSTGIS